MDYDPFSHPGLAPNATAAQMNAFIDKLAHNPQEVFEYGEAAAVSVIIERARTEQHTRHVAERLALIAFRGQVYPFFLDLSDVNRPIGTQHAA